MSLENIILLGALIPHTLLTVCIITHIGASYCEIPAQIRQFAGSDFSAGCKFRQIRQWLHTSFVKPVKYYEHDLIPIKELLQKWPW